MEIIHALLLFKQDNVVYVGERWLKIIFFLTNNVYFIFEVYLQFLNKNCLSGRNKKFNFIKKI